MARIVVLGAGMMGSALTLPLRDAGHEVRLLGTHLDDDLVRGVQQGLHPKLGVPLPPDVRAFPWSDAEDAWNGADAVALGVSSAGVRWAGRVLRNHAALPVLMVSKGLEWDRGTLRLLPDVLEEERGPGPRPVAVAGPCIAGELARRVTSIVVLAGRDPEQAIAWRERLATAYYHPRVTGDPAGTELCAALKNAYALAVALVAGEHERLGGVPGSVARHNVEAAVFAQALREMQDLLAREGANPDTAAGLAGAGDLDVTCNGGRTGRFGRMLGLGMGLERAVRAMEGATLECLEILAVMRRALADWDASGRTAPDDFPLLRALARIALDDAPPDLPLASFGVTRP